MLRSLAWTALFVAVLAIGAPNTLAETTTWDAVADWHTDHNTSTDTWQYYRTDTGIAGYTLNDNLLNWGGGQYAWANWSGGNYVCNIPNQPILDFGPTEQDVAIAWMSPINGTVTLSYALTMPNNAGETTNGIEYWVLQGATQLGHGILTKGETTGSLGVSNLSVAAGDKLYLRVGNNGASGYDDTRFTMTVTSVPEPATIAMLATGFIGFLAYAWRKRK